MQEFVPRCGGCDYDLSGLADGVCPECGRSFGYEELFAKWLARHRKRVMRVADWYSLSSVLLFLAAVVALASVGRERAAFAPGMYIPGALALLAWWVGWRWQRFEIAERRMPSSGATVWLLLMGCMTTLACVGLSVLMSVPLIVSLVLMGRLLARPGAPVAVRCVLFACGCVFIHGLAIAAGAAPWFWRHEHWSAWNALLQGRGVSTIALTNREVLVWSGLEASVSGALVLVLARVGRGRGSDVQGRVA